MNAGVAPWLPPAMAFSAMASGVLAGTFLVVWLWFVRRRHVLVWSLAWWAGTLHVAASWLLLSSGGGGTAWRVGHEVLVVLNAALMAAGSFDFVHRRLPVRALLALATPIVLWLVLSPWLFPQWAESAWPTAIAVGASYLWTATRFVHLRRARGTMGAAFVAALFALAGIHELDFPLVQAVPAFLPFGYALQALLANAISIGLLVMILEEARADAERERSTLRSIVDHLPVGVVVAGPAGEVRLSNPEAQRLLGKDVLLGGGSLLPQEPRVFRTPDGTPLAEGEGVLAATLRTGEAVPARELSADGPSRRRQSLLVNAGPVADERGGTSGAVLALQDIGRFKALQAELAQASRQQGLGTLAAGVAHDFNNALTMILGHAELAQSEAPEGAVKSSLDTILKVAGDSAAIVRRLQDVARTRSPVNLAPCDVAAVARDVLEIARPRWRDEAQAQGRSFAVEASFADALFVRGDAAELREALLNLVLNALDAMPRGGRLTVSGEAIDGEAVVRVADTGEGMPAQVRERIFDPYFTTKGSRGTGLGLAVTFGIVQRHAGHVGVDSEPGAGTTVTLRLPLAPRAEAAPAEAPSERARPLRVLVVDDEALVRTLLASLLSLEGHESVLAESGKQALILAAETAFDVVLTDLGMPGMNGWELAARLRSESPGTRVALVTGWGDTLPQDQVEGSGVAAVLTKPFTRTRLVECLRRAVPA